MSSSADHLLDTVISEALELPPSLRQEYLRKTLEDKPELLQKAIALINGLSNDAPTSFLDQLPAVPNIDELITPFEEPGPSLKPGAKVNSFKIVKLLDEGGMGEVYLAEQKIGRTRRKAAIKVVHSNLATSEVRQRFKYEQQILAGLQHPNIATLYDADVTEDGVPFLAMEYIQGKHIDKYCNKQTLSVEERLKIFKTVCDAVQYAQDNLVVHRDLKPSNILVTKTGLVKLLDFGIAKLRDTSPDVIPSEPNGVTKKGILNGASKLTQITQIQAPYTPAYAAPEQFHGDPVNAATDVYALGVILFELLTGLRPEKPEDDASTKSTHDTIRTGDHIKPSRQLTRHKTDENEKKSEKISVQRGYKNLNHLRRKLTGDLDTIVLKALEYEGKDRYTSAGELGRDIQRYLDRRPIQARAQTFGYRGSKFIRRYHRTVIAATIGFMVLLGGITTTLRQSILTQQQTELKEKERRGKEAIANFISSVMNKVDPAKSQGYTFTAREIIESGLSDLDDLKSYPEVYVEVSTLIGMVSMEVGLYDLADSLLHRAIDVHLTISDSDNPALAEPYLRLAEVYERTNKIEEAEAFFMNSLRLDPTNFNALNNTGLFYLSQGNLDKSIFYLEQASEINPFDHLPRINLAAIYFYLKNWQKAQDLYKEAIDIKPNYESFSNLATLTYYIDQDYSEAAKLFSSALQINDSNYETWGYHAAAAIETHAQQKEALTSFEEAIKRAEQHLQHVNQNDPGVNADIAGYYFRIGNRDKALEHLNQSILSEQPKSRSTIYTIGYTKALLGEHEEAVAYFNEALRSGYQPIYLLNEPSLQGFRNSPPFKKIQFQGEIE